MLPTKCSGKKLQTLSPTHPNKNLFYWWGLFCTNGPKAATIKFSLTLSIICWQSEHIPLLLLNKNRKVGLKLFQFLRSPKNYVPDVPNIKTPHFTKLPDTMFFVVVQLHERMGCLQIWKDNDCMNLVFFKCQALPIWFHKYRCTVRAVL